MERQLDDMIRKAAQWSAILLIVAITVPSSGIAQMDLPRQDTLVDDLKQEQKIRTGSCSHDCEDSVFHHSTVNSSKKMAENPDAEAFLFTRNRLYQYEI
jgi:hypothetical protein